MADTAGEVIEGITTRLKAFTAVSNLVDARIYTAVPQNEVFPYIVLGIESDDYSTMSSSDMMHIVRVQAFSTYNGTKEALEIRAAAVAALDRQEDNVTVTGATVVRLQKSGLNTVFIEPDGITWQSVIQFEMVVQS